MMIKEKTKTGLLAWSILIALVFIWGSSFILMKKGLIYFTSDKVGALRICISFLVLLPFSLKNVTKLSRKQLGYLFIVGALSNAAPAFLFSYAQTGIDSSMAGILNSTVPLFALIIGLMFFRYKGKWYHILGVLIGFTGVIGLLQISGDKTFEFNFYYAKFVLLATIFYAININIVKYRLSEVEPVTLTSVALLLVGIPILFYLLGFTDFISQMQNIPASFAGLGYVALLGIFGTSLALIAFNRLIKMVNVVFAASVTYLIPIVAILWGVLDGEKLKLIQVLWIVLIIAGVILVRNREDESQDPHAIRDHTRN